MRKNRKTSRTMSVVAERAFHVAAVIVMLFVMVILNFLASSSCDQLMKSIGDKERTLGKLEESRQRESAKWEEMIAPDRLERHLVRHGLSMRYPKAAQTIRMRADGTPYPGQLSLVKADARVQSRSVALASNRPAPRATAASVRPVSAPARRREPAVPADRRFASAARARRR
ncbi:MAG: hypothetical protein ACI4R9_05495 [Kiritimatiellia bacterium]